MYDVHILLYIHVPGASLHLLDVGPNAPRSQPLANKPIPSIINSGHAINGHVGAAEPHGTRDDVNDV